MGREQRLREHVVERADPQERDHDGLVDGAPDALGAAGGGHALVTADDRDDRAEAASTSAPSPTGRSIEALANSVSQNGPSGWPLTSSASDAAEDAEQQRVDVEQAGDDHQREKARHDEVLDRVDAEHLQRVELLAHLARAEVGGDRGAGDAGDDDRR